MARRHRRSKVRRVVNLVKKIVAFFFSHIGLCALVSKCSEFGTLNKLIHFYSWHDHKNWIIRVRVQNLIIFTSLSLGYRIRNARCGDFQKSWRGPRKTSPIHRKIGERKGSRRNLECNFQHQPIRCQTVAGYRTQGSKFINYFDLWLFLHFKIF